MKTLADEILDALPAMMRDHPRGASVEDIANLLCADAAHVRSAMKALHDDERASLARWPGSKRRYLVPFDHNFGGRLHPCPNCYVVFKMNQNGAACCSRECGSQRFWSRLDTDQRRARTDHLITKSRSPESRAKLSARAKAYSADPAHRAALSARSKAWWADPAKKAVLAAKIQKATSAPNWREAMSERRKRDWQDPAYREKMVKAHREAAATPEYRQRRSEVSKKLWADPIMGEKMRANSRENVKHAIAAVRGTKQTPEQVRKRVESARRTRQANRALRPTCADRAFAALAAGSRNIHELVAALGDVKRQTIYAALHEMIGVGQVESTRCGRGVRYARTDREGAGS
jgi:hypothetical protein